MLDRPQIVPAVIRSPASRLLEMNPLRRYVRSWVQGTDRASRIALDGAVSADDSIKVDAEEGLTGDFEVTHFTSDHLGPYRLEIYVGGGTNQKLMDVPIHVDLICGTAEEPFYLPSSIFLEANTVMNVKITNLATTITNQVRLKAHGRRFLKYAAFMNQRQLAEQFFGRGSYPYFAGLNDTSITLTASQLNVSGVITIPSAADLEAEYLVGKTQGLVRLRIQESKTGSPIAIGGGRGSLLEQGVESSHIIGNARKPYRFTPDPAFLARGNRVETVWDDISAASNRVELALVGRLLPFPDKKRPPAGVPRVVAVP